VKSMLLTIPKFSSLKVLVFRKYPLSCYLSPSLFLGHFSCFFFFFCEWAWFFFHSSNCCFHIFGMLGIDHFYICHSFSIEWSSFFLCNSTCWNWHFLILYSIMRYTSHVTSSFSRLGFTLWEPSGLVLFSITSFFDELLTWARVCFASN